MSPPFALLAVWFCILGPVTSCSPVPGEVTRGYAPNQSKRKEVEKIGRDEVNHIRLADFPNMCDPEGEIAVVRKPRLVAALVDSLRVAEYKGVTVSNHGSRIMLCDAGGRERVNLNMDYPSAAWYIGHAWTSALLGVRQDYATQLRRRVRGWKSTDLVTISQHVSLPSAGEDAGVGLPSRGKAERHAENTSVVLSRPEEVSQLLVLLSSGDPRLYSFDSIYRAPLRVDTIRGGIVESVFVVLPAVRPNRNSAITLDPSLEELGTKPELLQEMALVLRYP